MENQLNERLTNLRHALGQSKKDRELQPYKANVFFINGYVYATDGIVMFKAPIENYIKNPSLLEGRHLHFNDLVTLSKAKEHLYVEEDKISCGVWSIKFENHIYESNGRKYFSKDGVSIPDFDSVIPEDGNFEHCKFSLDPAALLRLSKCFNSPELVIKFSSNKNISGFPSHAFRVTSPIDTHLGEVGILMPKIHSLKV